MRYFAMALAVTAFADSARGDDVVKPANERFAAVDVKETPSFRKHVVPLMGKLGCNGRACHGSFQGQGGFRLSLFGYDFQMDHEGLTKGDKEKDKFPRVDLEFPAESLALEKPTLAMPHKGGKRMEVDSWQYRVFLNWIKDGAKPVAKDHADFVRLDVTPAEIVFAAAGKKQPLKVVAVWSDGTREDVTPLCRFQSNNDQVAVIDELGMVTSDKPGDTHVVVFYDSGVVPIPVIQPVSDKVGPQYPDVPTPTMVDQLVVEKLRKLGVVPADLSSDAEFLRRVSLDMTGTLPAPQEVESFLADSSPDKRARKVDELLERPTYSAWWTTKLCDYTGNNDYELRNTIPVRENTRPARDWYEWIYQRVNENVSYDKIVEGIVVAKSRDEQEDFETFVKNMRDLYQDSSDQSFAQRETMPYYWARRNLRNPDERAIGFAYTFMGIRIQCAQCHKHPFDQWTQDDFKQFTGFFDRSRMNFGINPESRNEYREMMEKLDLGDLNGGQQRRELANRVQKGELVPFQELYVTKAPKPSKGKDNRRNRGRGPATAKLLGGDVIDLTATDDPRIALMEWMRSKDHPLFARAFVNRVWASYFNVGIVEPPDDLSLANPPSNEPLLNYLATEFINQGFDMKWLHREIANSHTYQASWKPNETNALDDRNFSHAIPRRLPAEVAYDALKQATGSDGEIAKLTSETDDRAIAIPGASSRYGRNQYALSIFGRSIRESNCDCDRSAEASLLQTVFLQNDQEVFQLIDRNRVGWIDQVAQQYHLRNKASQAAKKKLPARPKNFDQQVESMQTRIKRLKEADNAEEAKKMQRRLSQYVRRFAKDESAKDADADDRKAVAANTFDADAVIKGAYLRTLSRYPTAEELDRSKSYLATAEDPLQGARGLLWALLNTKEFIVNH